MAEQQESFLIRMLNGPHEATRKVGTEHGYTWPLDATFTCKCHTQGEYVKIRESQLPPQPGNTNGVVRGAEYEWKEFA